MRRGSLTRTPLPIGRAGPCWKSFTVFAVAAIVCGCAGQAATPIAPNGVSVAGDRVGAVPDRSIRAEVTRDDASRKLRFFGVSY